MLSVGRVSDSMMIPTLELVGTRALSSVAWPTGIPLVIIFYFRLSVVLFDFPGNSSHATPCACLVLVMICLTVTSRDSFCNRTADQRLCFRYTDGAVPLLP